MLMLVLAVTSPSFVDAVPAAAITGPPNLVYDWASDHCPGKRGSWETRDPKTGIAACPNDVQLGCDPDVPDAPMKAFRNASGTVVLLAPLDLGSRSLVGPSLSDVRKDCHVNMNSTLDYKMSDSACREWIQVSLGSI